MEICVRNTGKGFHNEIGKYRFLNELIRVVSPKYLAPRCSTEVKNRVIEMMYSWTIGLKEQTKILDAYSMLKKQGIVKQDPKFDQRLLMPTPPPKERYLFNRCWDQNRSYKKKFLNIFWSKFFNRLWNISYFWDKSQSLQLKKYITTF